MFLKKNMNKLKYVNMVKKFDKHNVRPHPKTLTWKQKMNRKLFKETKQAGSTKVLDCKVEIIVKLQLAGWLKLTSSYKNLRDKSLMNIYGNVAVITYWVWYLKYTSDNCAMSTPPICLLIRLLYLLIMGTSIRSYYSNASPFHVGIEVLKVKSTARERRRTYNCNN